MEVSVWFAELLLSVTGSSGLNTGLSTCIMRLTDARDLCLYSAGDDGVCQACVGSALAHPAPPGQSFLGRLRMSDSKNHLQQIRLPTSLRCSWPRFWRFLPTVLGRAAPPSTAAPTVRVWASQRYLRWTPRPSVYLARPAHCRPTDGPLLDIIIHLISRRRTLP
ncbi:hypothetical protein VTN96DRAFT_4073 [Rasamsonia emersonii]